VTITGRPSTVNRKKASIPESVAKIAQHECPVSKLLNAPITLSVKLETASRRNNMSELKILGIVGSLRKDSYNAFALKAAQELLPEGVSLETVSLLGIPVFNQDDETAPPAAVLEFKQKIMAADAILFATPEYNYSLPGGLKNAIDWGSRPYGQSAWQGKAAAIMGVSIGNFGTARAQYDLRKILVALDMPVVVQPEVMIGNAAERFDQNGVLTDERSRNLIKKLLNALVQLEKSVRRSNG
jgi:chromate reductase